MTLEAENGPAWTKEDLIVSSERQRGRHAHPSSMITRRKGFEVFRSADTLAELVFQNSDLSTNNNRGAGERPKTRTVSSATLSNPSPHRPRAEATRTPSLAASFAPPPVSPSNSLASFAERENGGVGDSAVSPHHWGSSFVTSSLFPLFPGPSSASSTGPATHPPPGGLQRASFSTVPLMALFALSLSLFSPSLPSLFLESFFESFFESLFRRHGAA